MLNFLPKFFSRQRSPRWVDSHRIIVFGRNYGLSARHRTVKNYCAQTLNNGIRGTYFPSQVSFLIFLDVIDRINISVPQEKSYTRSAPRPWKNCFKLWSARKRELSNPFRFVLEWHLLRVFRKFSRTPNITSTLTERHSRLDHSNHPLTHIQAAREETMLC